MTEKRFKPHLFDDGESERYFDGIIDNENDNDIIVNYHSISNLLNALHEENQMIKQTIREMMESERTTLGKSVLKQLWDRIQ